MKTSVWSITPISLKVKSYLTAVIIVMTAFILMPTHAQAITLSSSRDCDANAVISCGALSINELQSKYNNDQSTQNIYSAFGISGNDIHNMDATAVAGSVTSTGRVIVNGKTVANNAETAGRQLMAGSHSEDFNGTVFYSRSPSVSFASSTLPAFVVMDKNGRFDFAIIASCGNPVNAHPTTVKQVPNTSSSTNTVIRQQPVAQPSSVAQTQSQSVTVAPTPSPAVTYTPPPAPVVYQAAPTTPSTTYVAPKQIPNTGIGDIAGIGSLVTLVSGFAHLLYKRKFIT
jgi:hypothetical protein